MKGLPGDSFNLCEIDRRAVVEFDLAGGILGQGDDVVRRVGRDDRT